MIITAKELRVGNEIKVTVMGGEEYLTVTDLDNTPDGVLVRMEWGWHVPISEPVTQVFDRDAELTIR